MIIAIDFDGTLVEKGKYPKIGKETPYAFDALKKLQEEGHKLILWTVREGDRLKEAVEFCQKKGISFYAVNMNNPNEKFDDKNYSRKLKADIFIDDRSIGGIPEWKKVQEIIKNKRKRNFNNMDDKREIRNTSYEVTVDSESRAVEGYALLFDTPSTGLPFTEVIERGALEGVLSKSDVFALLNHNQSRGILARSNKGQGSLRLSIDAKGLKYRFEAPNSPLGDELLENLKRGEIDSSSFAFTVDKDTWERCKDGKIKRTIHKVAELFDVSPVYNAAYSQTSVYKRGMDDLEAEEGTAGEESLKTYYAKIEKFLINNF